MIDSTKVRNILLISLSLVEKMVAFFEMHNHENVFLWHWLILNYAALDEYQKKAVE